MSERVSWDAYFMGFAVQAASRATCPRRHVGCALVVDRSVIVTGYNGSVRAMPHCCDVGCEMVDGHCCRTVHAEANAITQAARRGHATEGATAYVTAVPCWPCFRLLANAGITRIVCGSAYGESDAAVVTAAVSIGIVMEYLGAHAASLLANEIADIMRRSHETYVDGLIGHRPDGRSVLLAAVQRAKEAFR